MSDTAASTGVRARLEGLPANVRGAAWIISAAVAFAAMGVLIKMLGARGMDGIQIAFFRALFGFFALCPFLFRHGIGILATSRWRMHAVRVLAGNGAMLCIFTAITMMPLATATAIAYARPLFLIVLAVFFLGETIRWRRWAATLAGFAGVMMIVRPGADALDPAALIALFAAFLMAVAMVAIKKLSDTERPLTMLAWFAIASVVVSGLPAIFVWQTPDAEAWLLSAGMGILGSIGQYAVIRAFRVGEASAIVPFDYAQIPLAWLLGAVFFAEQPGLWTWLGTLTIVGANLYIVRRESQLNKNPPRPPDT